MGRMIRRFEGNKARNLPPIDFMAADFNGTAPTPYELYYQAADGIRNANESLSIDISCSEKTPGIVLSVRDTDIKLVLDEQETINAILENISRETQSLWKIKYMRDKQEELAKLYIHSVVERDEVLYCGLELETPAVIYSNGIPLGIARKVCVGDRSSHLEHSIQLHNYVGTSFFDNVITPYVEFLTENKVWRIDINRTNYNIDTKLMHVDIEGKKLTVVPKAGTDYTEIPLEIVNGTDEEIQEYLNSKRTSRQQNKSFDIDLF